MWEMNHLIIIIDQLEPAKMVYDTWEHLWNIEHRRNLMLAKQRSQTAYMNLWFMPATKIVNVGTVLSILKVPVNPGVNQVVRFIWQISWL